MGDGEFTRTASHLRPGRGRLALRSVPKKWLVVALAAAVALALLVRAVLLHYAERDLDGVKAGLSFGLVPSRNLPMLWGAEPSPDQNAAQLYVEAQRRLSAILYPDDGSCDPTPEWIERAMSQEEPVHVRVADLLAYVSGRSQGDPYHQLQDLLGIWGLEEYYGPSGYGFALFDEVEDAGEQEAFSPQTDSLPPRDVAAAREFLAQFADVLRLRDEAVKRPYCLEPVDWDHPGLARHSDGRVKRLFELADITLLESAIAAHEHQWDEAYEKICMVLLMARHLEQNHLLDSQFCASAIRRRACEQLARLLALSRPCSDISVRLRPLLAFDARRRVRDMMASEAAFTNGLFESETRSGLPDSLLGEGAAGARWDRFASWALRHLLVRQHARVLEAISAYYEAAGVASHWERHYETIDRDFTRLSRHFAWQGPMSVQWPGQLHYVVVDLYVQAEALGAMATVALDVAAFRESNGHCPAALSDLANCDRLPNDPFSGKSLLYRRTGGGFVLWSVGPDGDDDGGTSHRELGGNPLSDGDIVLRAVPCDSNCEAGEGGVSLFSG
jgi:hypothetical protein